MGFRGRLHGSNPEPRMSATSQKRTWISTAVMSALCQERTYAVQQNSDIRRPEDAAVGGIDWGRTRLRPTARFSRCRGVRRAVDRRDVPQGQRRWRQVVRSFWRARGGSFSSIRFLFAMVCCCTNSMFRGRRRRSYESRMSADASPRSTRPSSPASSIASWIPKLRPSPPIGLLTWAASPTRNTRRLRKLAATLWWTL
jgi:hypothetical protein